MASDSSFWHRGGAPFRTDVSATGHYQSVRLSCYIGMNGLAPSDSFCKLGQSNYIIVSTYNISQSGKYLPVFIAHLFI